MQFNTSLNEKELEAPHPGNGLDGICVFVQPDQGISCAIYYYTVVLKRFYRWSGK